MSRSKRRADLRKIRQESERKHRARWYLKEYFDWMIACVAAGWKWGDPMLSGAPQPPEMPDLSLGVEVLEPCAKCKHRNHAPKICQAVIGFEKNLYTPCMCGSSHWVEPKPNE